MQNQDYNKIKEFTLLKDENIFKFFYFNKKKLHEKLFEEEEVIEVDNTINKNIILYFYLNLLINDNLTIVNYIYSLDLITKLNDSQKKNDNKKYKKIINSKVIVDLIENYKNSDKYEEGKDDEILDEIESDNQSIIQENEYCLTEIGLYSQQKDIISKKIDEIYIEIIISLIESKKFDEKAENIVKELDLENIDITIKMFDKISEILDSDKYYIINKLEKAEDLYDEKKINFYYILFKYILKNSIYIYKNFSLMKSRKALLK